MSDIGRMVLQDYRLTTAEILYRFPDHPSLLQTYIWQDLDLNPDFPVLKKFLAFWNISLEGKLYAVKVAVCDDIRSTEYRHIPVSLLLH
jgi:uncharacterized protein Usg